MEALQAVLARLEHMRSMKMLGAVMRCLLWLLVLALVDFSVGDMPDYRMNFPHVARKHHQAAVPALPCRALGNFTVKVDCHARAASLFADPLCEKGSWVANVSLDRPGALLHPSLPQDWSEHCEHLTRSRRAANSTSSTAIPTTAAAATTTSPLSPPPGCLVTPVFGGGINLACTYANLTAVPLVSPQLRASLSGTIDLSHNRVTQFGNLAGLGLDGLTLSYNSLTAMPYLGMLQSLDVLVLSNNAITAIDPLSVAADWQLQSMDLSSNKLTVLTVAMLNASIAGTLNLNNNQITSIEPGTFTSTNTLPTEIDLACNNLTSIGSNLFSGNFYFSTLDLSNNAVTSLAPSAFAGSQVNVLISLRFNALTQIESNAFAGLSLSTASTFDLSHNKLQSITAQSFAGLQATSFQLNLSHNNISSIDETSFANLASMLKLDLSYNRIGWLPPALFAATSALTDLNISNNRVTAINPNQFSNLSTLTTLDLSGNQISDLPVGAFASLISLFTLSLANNFLTEIKFGVFQLLNTLRTLDLASNRITSVSATLANALPNPPDIFSLETLVGSCGGSLAVRDCPLPFSREISVKLLLDLSANPIVYASRTAFDALNPYISVAFDSADSFVLHASECCGMGWFANFSRLRLPAIVMCGSIPLRTAVMDSACMCKRNAIPNIAQPLFPSAMQTVCFQAANITFIPSYLSPNGSGYCSNTGCLPGQRSMRMHLLEHFDRTILAQQCQYYAESADPQSVSGFLDVFETSCQECFVTNCTSCNTDFLRCDLCNRGLFSSADGKQCNANCPNGTFGNTMTRACSACPAGCALCVSSKDGDARCTSCQNTYVLSQGVCIACSVAIALGIPFPPGACEVNVLTASSSGEVPLAKILPAVLIVTGALILVAVFVVRHQRRRAVAYHEKLLNTEQEMQVTQKELDVLRKAWEISWDEIESGRCIGEGAMGQVWRGSWRGMPVAIKVLKGVYAGIDGIKEEMDREATMLQTLRHAHVVQFLGAGTNAQGTPFIVTELMDLGALTSLLRPSLTSQTTHAHASPASTSYVLQQDDWATKIRFACEVASGMSLVHSLGRLHRDLKSGNVLATLHNGTVRLKVADFGTATLAGCAGSPMQQHGVVPRSREDLMLTKGIGTTLWMAPEIMAGRKYGPSADVYSYAVLLWEIAAQCEPWPDVQGQFIAQVLLTRIESGERLPIDAAWPTKYVALMQRCWDLDPAARPAFASVPSLLQ